MDVSVKMVTVMDHMAETGTIASVDPRFTRESMPLWEAHQMIRKHVANLSHIWLEVNEYSATFTAEGCKVYRTVITYYGTMSYNRDVFYVWSLDPETD